MKIKRMKLKDRLDFQKKVLLKNSVGEHLNPLVNVEYQHQLNTYKKIIWQNQHLENHPELISHYKNKSVEYDYRDTISILLGKDKDKKPIYKTA